MKEVRAEGRLQVAFDGTVGNWFCPTHPANVQREIDGFMELANLGANGIMLDYFRYPDENYCFCPRCRARFEKTIGRTVAKWPADVRNDADLAKRWSAFRRDVMTDVLRTIRAELRRRAPKLELSSAVAATVEGADARGQDWPQWCREGLLDRLFPMCYNSTSKLLRRDLETLTGIVGKTQTKLTPMTCFACGDIPFLSLEEICRQIDTVRGFGLSDLAFFRLTEYAPYVLKALRSGPLKDGEVVLRPGATEVVIGRKAPSIVRFAAEEATNFLAQALGASVPLVHEPTAGRTSVILGENEWSRTAGLRTDDLARDAYRVKAEGDRVYVLGRDDKSFDLHGFLARKTGYGILLHGHERATLFGVYGLLEKYAGVRFIFPDEELGTVVKRADAIRIPSGVETVAPDYLLRNPYFGGDGRWHVEECGGRGPKEILWLRHRYASMIIPCCHGSQWFKYMERFGLRDRPDFMALKSDGMRWLDPKVFAPNQLCWSNPDLHEEMYQDIKAYLTGQPASSRGLKSWGVNCRDRRYVDIMPDDSFNECRCERCHAAYRHDLGKDYATELMWGLVGKLAQRLQNEGVKGDICMMAYPPYRRVPDFALPTNIQVMVATTGPWAMVSEERLASDRAIVDTWSKKLGHKVWAWTYPHKFGRTMIKGVPCFGAYAWGKYFQRFQYGLFGSFAESDCDCAFYNHLNYYVFSRVCWDANADVNAVIAEFHRLMFGAGAEEMSAFYKLLEKKWLKEVTGRVEETSVGPVAKPPSAYQLWHDVYSPEIRTALRGLLAEAVTKVGRGSVEARRIALVKREVYDPLVRAAKAFEEATDLQRGLRRRASEPNRSILSEKGWGGAFVRDTKTFVTPPDSIRFEGDSTAAVQQYLQGQHGTPPLKPNTRYRLSYFVRYENVVPAKKGGGVYSNVWTEGQNWYPVNHCGHTGTAGWIYQEQTFVSRPEKGEYGGYDACSLSLCLRDATGTAWFDDVLLEELGRE